MKRTAARMALSVHRPGGGQAWLLPVVLACLCLPLLAAADSVSESVLHAFSGSDGSGVNSTLVQAADGDFYGTTPAGGASGAGTVFKLTAQGSLSLLHSFNGQSDGNMPQGGLAIGIDGNLYGTTLSGGANGFGSVFRISTNGVFKTIASFASGQGNFPYAALVRDAEGNFYGTTYQGGSHGLGTVFRITPAGVITTLHSFSGVPDGANPMAALVFGADGMLYGSAMNQGADSEAFGTIFSISTSGTFSLLHAFVDNPQTGNDGGAPRASLLPGVNGNFYGTTSALGGADYAGTVFSMTSAGVLTALHDFDGAAEGGVPYGGLIQAKDGSLLGTTSSGGGMPEGLGTVFRLTTQGTLYTLHVFRGAPDGTMPAAGLLQGSDGALYGTTALGGGGSGTVFRIVDSTPSVSFTVAAEQTPKGNGSLPSVQLTVQLSATSIQPVTIPFSLGGTESASRYAVTPSGQLVIPAGATSATITVNIEFPPYLQCDKTVVLSLGTPDFATLGTISANTLTVHNYLGLFCPK